MPLRPCRNRQWWGGRRDAGPSPGGSMVYRFDEDRRPAQTVFRELASGGRVRALPQRPRRAGGAGGAFPGPAGYPPRPFDGTRTRRWGGVGLTHPRPDRRAAGRPSRRANRPQAASNRVASDRPGIMPTPLHPLPPPHRTPAERPPPRRDRGMIAWARARAGKTVRETGGPLKGQGKWRAGRMVGPCDRALRVR